MGVFNLEGLLRSILSLSSGEKSKKTHTSPLNVPPELIYMILEHLPPESVVSFCLACRAFYKFRPKNFGLPWSAKEAFLVFLERDVPSLYYCYVCGKLHSWNVRGGSIPPTYDGACRKQLLQYDQLPSGCYNFQYHTARIIMNRHLYGPGHGPSLHEYQNIPMRKRTNKSKITTYSSFNTRIIDGELFVHETRIISQPKGDESRLKAFIKSTLITCHHLPVQRAIPELRHNTGRGTFVGGTGSLRSCAICFTDYQMDVIPHDKWEDGQDVWIIKYQKWHQLGDCRSSWDAKWRALASDGRLGDFRPRFMSCEAGAIRDKWVRQDLSDSEFGTRKAYFMGLCGEVMEKCHLLVEVGFRVDLESGSRQPTEAWSFPYFFLRCRRGRGVISLHPLTP